MVNLRNCVVAHSVRDCFRAMTARGMVPMAAAGSQAVPSYSGLPVYENGHLREGTACLFDGTGTPQVFRYQEVVGYDANGSPV